MPYVEGESLRDRLNREKQLPIGDAVRIASEVASALDYAHRHGVIHRDIKPENILLHDGRALVADFGIALAASKAGGTRMTETGMSLGTPHYMSPEQAMGEREITARSDVYALGAMTYEMLVGDPPFIGATAQAIVAKVLTERPAPPSTHRETVPESVEDAVLVALAKLPADRWPSAAAFVAALEGQASPGRPRGSTATRPIRVPPTSFLSVRSPWPWAVGFALAAVAAFWGGFARRRLQRHRSSAWKCCHLQEPKSRFRCLASAPSWRSPPMGRRWFSRPAQAGPAGCSISEAWISLVAVPCLEPKGPIIRNFRRMDAGSPSAPPMASSRKSPWMVIPCPPSARSIIMGLSAAGSRGSPMGKSPLPEAPILRAGAFGGSPRMAEKRSNSPNWILPVVSGCSWRPARPITAAWCSTAAPSPAMPISESAL